MKKFNKEYISDYLADKHLMLVGEYKDCRSKVEIECLVCGAKFKKTFDSIKSKGVGCNECAHKNKWNSLRFSHEDARKLFEDNGCVLLEPNYINARMPLKYRCICGKESSITLDNFKRGVRCQQCKKNNNSGCLHWNWNNDRIYIAVKKSMNFRCSKLLRRTLLAFYKAKIGHTKDLLGYTPQELHAKLKSDDNNFDACSREWTVDHVFPIKAFVDYGIFDVKIINALDNLQPMKQSANSSKGSNYSKKKFEAWLKTKGVCCGK